MRASEQRQSRLEKFVVRCVIKLLVLLYAAHSIHLGSPCSMLYASLPCVVLYTAARFPKIEGRLTLYDPDPLPVYLGGKLR